MRSRSMACGCRSVLAATVAVILVLTPDGIGLAAEAPVRGDVPATPAIGPASAGRLGSTTISASALGARAGIATATPASATTAGAVSEAGAAAVPAKVAPVKKPTPAKKLAPTKKPAPKKKGPPPIPFSDLHKRAVLIIMPTGYAAHVGKTTGENLEVFLAWYIGTFANEEGLFIAPIFSLLVGADAKWSFLSERKYRPAVAIGYYGGLAVPFTGGVVQASSLADEEIKQTFIHNGYLAMSKRFGIVTATVGGLYGIKKGFGQFLPMLRNSSYTTETSVASEELITAYGGVDVKIRSTHLKLELITLPQETSPMPWLVHTHIDAFLGFDIGYTRDRLGYQIIGYYMLPFIRWPSKKKMEKERDRLRLRERGR